VREIIIIFNWLERGGFAEESEMMDWYRVGEEGLYGYHLCQFHYCVYTTFNNHLPSSIPKPDRRIGTIEIVEGDISVVVNSYPRGVLLCRSRQHSSRHHLNNDYEL
jgi:hypothetical protein